MRDQLPHKGLEAWKWTDMRAAVGTGDLTGFDAPLHLCFHGPEGSDDRGLMLTGPEPADPSEAMGRIAAEYADGVTSIIVPDGETYEAPLEIRDITAGNARLRIEVGAGASLKVAEYHEAESGFSNLDIHYVVKDGGSLTRSVLTTDGEAVIRHVRAHVTLWDQAKFDQVQLTFGSALTRLETRIACMGKTEIDLSGAYLLGDERHADMTNYIDFAAPGTVMRDSVSGVATDKSRAVFQGKFHVRRPAQETDAEMRHDALLLSDKAKINAKPELEIYADDVECAHGNTIGQLDEQALFYMRQRGIPLPQARALLIEAFIAARLRGDETMLDLVRDWLERQA